MDARRASLIWTRPAWRTPPPRPSCCAPPAACRLPCRRPSRAQERRGLRLHRRGGGSAPVLALPM
eukprot:scaffold46319_cov51-Phaeocystis_antarctica.AAC.1